MKGKFIVIYGANNLGKSIQINELAKKLLSDKVEITVIKYPIYNLKPTGPRINKILRDPKFKDRNISETDLQQIYVQNRADFQPTIKKLLSAGINVLAEDYVGTSIAWGTTNSVYKEGVKRKFIPKLIKKFEILNKNLISPDLSILLDGERFDAGIEKAHRNEDNGNSVWELNREIYKILGEKYDWKVINANQTITDVADDIWHTVEAILE